MKNIFYAKIAKCAVVMVIKIILKYTTVKPNFKPVFLKSDHGTELKFQHNHCTSKLYNY